MSCHIKIHYEVTTNLLIIFYYSIASLNGSRIPILDHKINVTAVNQSQTILTSVIHYIAYKGMLTSVHMNFSIIFDDISRLQHLTENTLMLNDSRWLFKRTLMSNAYNL